MHRLVISLVTLIGLTGAAFLAGYLFLFSAASDRAATLAPAGTAFYANVYLQPSAGQQMNLSGLIGRLPGFADEASLDDKVDQIVGNALDAAGLDLDYEADVKPWLGNQVAVAGWTDDAATEPVMVAIIDLKDVALARSTLADLAERNGVDVRTETVDGGEILVGDEGAYAFVSEMLVVSDGPEALERVVAVAGGDASLADRDDFTTTMADLPTDHLASLFIDVAALGESTDTSAQLSAFSTAGAALVAERDGLRLSGRAPFDVEGAASSATAGFGLGGEPSSLVDWMPGDSVAEVVIFGLRQTLEDAEEAAASMPEGQEALGALDTIRALAAFGLGIDIDEDLLPLVDREVGIAFTGFDGDLPRGQILLRPEDPEGGADALERLVGGLSGIGASTSVEEHDGDEITVVTIPDTIEVAYAVRDGIIIIGTGPEDVIASLDAHADGSGLATDDAYVRAFEIAGTRAGNEIFVDVGAVVDLAGDSFELPADLRDILSRIGTFGFTAPSRDDQIEFHAVLTVDEP
ncbi:MAG: DUF3352 domain-containing protein [Chloroflexi bacterium]|nr:DUF3352 domain-containing protein [Chloroflexota bacterium]